ncbi:MAG: chromate resistance protein ChrB domain-containing protein [Pseudolabrys sp.]
MKWITREYVKVDRVACPWLIKKFVDKSAEFIFVPADKVMAEAKRLDAIPYDVKNVELGHHGKECSFEAILKKYKLANESSACPSWENCKRRRHRQYAVSSTGRPRT